MKLKINTQSFEDLAREFRRKASVIDEAKKQFFKAESESVQRDLQETLPNKTWKLRGSLKVKVSKNTAEVYTNSKYAKFLESWTKAHMIRPKKAKALSWDWKLSKGHMVKGIKAWNYFERIYEAHLKSIKKRWQKLLQYITKKR